MNLKVGDLKNMIIELEKDDMDKSGDTDMLASIILGASALGMVKDFLAHKL